MSDETNALERLRAWAATSGRWYELERDVGCADCLTLGELPTLGVSTGPPFVSISSDDDPHTEDNPATLAEMVDAALARWEELYGKDGGA